MAKGRIEANDIISKEALASIDLLGTKLKTALDQIDSMILKSKTLTSALGGSASWAELNKNIQAQGTNLKDLDDKKKQAEKTNETLKKSQEELIKTQIIEGNARRDLKKEIEINITLESKEAGTLEKLAAENKKLSMEKRKLNLETEEGRKRLVEINAILDKNTEIIRANGSAAEKQRMNIGNYASAFDGMPGPVAKAASAVKAFGVTLKALAATNPIVLAITAVIAAVAGLFKIFTSTGEGAKFVKTVLAELGAVLDVVKNRVVAFGKGLSDLFRGKFKEGFQEMGAAVSGVGDQLVDAAEAAKEYVNAMSLINKQRAAHLSEEAEEQNLIEKSIFLAKDKKKTDKERIALLTTALQLSSDMAAREKQFAEDEYNATIKNKAARVAHLGVTAELLDQFIKMPEAQQVALQKEEGMWKETWNILKTDGIKSLEELYAKGVEADTEFFRRNKRTASQLSTLRIDLQKEQEERIKSQEEKEKKAFDNKVKMLQEEAAAVAEMQAEDLQMLQDNARAKLEVINILRDAELDSLNKSYIKGEKSTEEYEKQKLAITKKYEHQILQTQLDTINETIKASTLSTNKKIELEAKAADLQKKISDNGAQEKLDSLKMWDQLELEELEAQEKAIDELRKDGEKKDKEAAERKMEIIEGIAVLTMELGNAIFETNNDRFENEIDQLESKRDKEIKAAGDSKEAQARINAKYDKLVAEQKTKQFKNDKQAALFQIAIDTAVGVTKYAAAQNWIMAALMAVIGGIQAGVVLSKKPPEFRLGTKDSPGGPAYVGEEGQELMIDTYGGVQLTPERKSLVYLKPHTQIIPAKETDLLLKKGLSINRDEPQRNVTIDMDPVVKAIQNKKEYTFNFRDDGVDITERQGRWLVNYKNNFKF